MGAGLWAGVERRRPALAVLRFLGMPSRRLALLPTLQAVTLGVVGVILALGISTLASATLNALFAGTLGLDRPLCRIGWQIAAIGLALTVAGAILASLLAGLRIARVEPWESMR